MNAKAFKKNQEEFNNIKEKINKFLSLNLGLDLTKYHSIAFTNNETAARAIEKEYNHYGWDIKLDDDLDYHNLSNEIEIFIKLRG